MSNILASLGIEIYGDTARLAGDLGKADRQVKDLASGITGHFTKMQAAITGIGAAIGVIGFGALINDVAKMRAGLDDLADAGLGTVESLSRIKNSAKAFNADFEGLTGAFSKMVKGLAGSEKETSKAGEALRRLGIEARDSSGELRKPTEIFEELSVALSGFKDGADKAAFAQAILGKGGEKYLPLLKDMAEEGTKAATVTAEQAAQADMYEKALRGVSKAIEGNKKQIAGEFIPLITALAQSFADLIHGVKENKAALDEFGSNYTLKNFAYDVGYGFSLIVDAGQGVVRGVELIGKAIGATAMDLVQFAKIGGGALLTMSGQSGIGLQVMNDGLEKLSAGGQGFKQDLDEIASRAWFSDQYTAKWDANIKKIAESAKDLRPALDSAGLGDSNETKEKANKFVQMLADANAHLAKAYAETLDPLNALTASEKKLIDLRESVDWTQITTGERIQLRVILEQAAALEKVVAGQKEWNKTVDEASKYADDFNKKQADELIKLGEKTEAINKEVENYGKLPSAIAEVKLAEEELALTNAKLNGSTQETINAFEDAAKAQRNYVAALKNKEGLQAQQDMLRVWGDLADGAGRFFADLVLHGRSAFDRLKDSLKSFAADLIALFAKKWLLNIAGNLIGGAPGQALIGTAANAGIGSLAGAGLGALGSAFTGGGIVNTLSGGLTGGIGAGLGGSPYAGAGALADIGSAIGTALPWIAGIVAAAALIKKLSGGGENPKAQLGFGGNAAAYATSGAFGAEGFRNIQTDDAFNKSLTAYFASFKGFDDKLAALLSKEAVGRVSASLAGQTQREFAFPKGDGTAGEQLQLEYLKSKYSIVFGELDKTFGDFVRSYTGKSDDLLKAILAEGQILDSLSSTTLKGLNINSLRALAGEGEGLADTLKRLTSGWDAINAVMDDAGDKAKVLEAQLRDAFGAIGQDLPRDIDAWRTLAGSIDLSTEAGRALFNTMSAGAQTFQQVQSALKSMINGIWSSAQSALGGGFSSALAGGRLNSSVDAWNALTSPGFTRQQTIANLSQITPETLQQIIAWTQQNFGAEGVALLNQVWSDYSAFVSAQGQATQGLTSSFNGLGGAVDNFASQLAGARENLAQYLRGSLLGDLSPLDPMARYNEARRQYDANFALAQGSNIDAIAGFGSIRDAFLQASRLVNGSNGQYNQDFFGTFNQGASLTNGSVRPYTAADAIAQTDRLIAVVQAGNATNDAIAQAIAIVGDATIRNATENTAETKALLQEAVNALKRLSSGGATSPALVGAG
jgi:hypothetical protein